MDGFHSEVASGQRFEFGQNWRQFLSKLNEQQIAESERSLCTLLQLDSLVGLRFLDIGSGSGLSSLAARRLGAKVHSFDFDPQSAACTAQLRDRYFPNDASWVVARGSALDEDYLRSLGDFDIVYSWGVLHHTGQMLRAMHLAQIPVKPGGKLVLALYNDQGILSSVWRKVKRIYCSGSLGRWFIIAVFVPLFAVMAIMSSIGKYRHPFQYFRNYHRQRGMSIYYDWLDWLGGLPFEVASPENVLSFYRMYGFSLTNLTTTNSFGCNQYVFERRM